MKLNDVTVNLDALEATARSCADLGGMVTVETETLLALTKVVRAAQRVLEPLERTYVMGGGANDFCDATDALRDSLKSVQA